MREATLDDRRTRSSVKSASGGLPANSTRVGVVTHAGCDSGLPPGVLFARIGADAGCTVSPMPNPLLDRLPFARCDVRRWR